MQLVASGACREAPARRHADAAVAPVDAHLRPAPVAPSFAEACADERKRPAYLAGVLARAPLPPYVVGVEYLDAARFLALRPPPAMRDNPPGFATVGAGLERDRPIAGRRRSRILVLPGAFDPARVESEEVFLLGLYEHELVHARLAFAGPPVEVALALGRVPRPAAEWLYDTLVELIAYRSELAAARRQALPASYYRKARDRYLAHYLDLAWPPVPLPPAMTDRLLCDYFESWMPAHATVLERRGRRWFFVDGGRRRRVPARLAAVIGATTP